MKSSKFLVENGENQRQMNSSVTKKCFKKIKDPSFFRLYFCRLLDQDQKINSNKKIGQFFAGFFHI